jgi:hypothetical protein
LGGFFVDRWFSKGEPGVFRPDRYHQEFVMKKQIATILVSAAALAGASAAHAADVTIVQEAPAPVVVAPAGPSDGVRIGYLDCGIGGCLGYVLGSAKSVDCAFVSALGAEPVDRYSGTIRKMGVDLGFTTQGRMIWAVFAPTAGYHQGSLGGIYKGATAEATAGLGVGANVLTGGTAGSVHLQTVSVQGQVGLNVAAAGTSMTLDAVN